MHGGVKFKDADLLGIPIRVTVGQKSLAEGNVEVKQRSQSESSKVKVKAATAKVIEIVNELKERLNI